MRWGGVGWFVKEKCWVGREWCKGRSVGKRINKHNLARLEHHIKTRFNSLLEYMRTDSALSNRGTTSVSIFPSSAMKYGHLSI